MERRARSTGVRQILREGPFQLRSLSFKGEEVIGDDKPEGAENYGLVDFNLGVKFQGPTPAILAQRGGLTFYGRILPLRKRKGPRSLFL